MNIQKYVGLIIGTSILALTITDFALAMLIKRQLGVYRGIGTSEQLCLNPDNYSVIQKESTTVEWKCNED